jgi:hypothetical protein
MNISNFLKNKFETTAKQQSTEAYASKLAEKYRPKSTYEAQSTAAIIAQMLAIGLGLLSAAYGTRGVYEVVTGGKGEGTLEQLALYSALFLLLLALEMFKQKAWKTALAKAFLANKIKTGAWLLGGCLALGSATLSVQGLQAIQAENWKGTETQVKNEQAVKLSELKAQRQNIIERNTWKGKTYLPKEERKLVQALEEKIINAEQREAQELKPKQEEHEIESAKQLAAIIGLETLILLLVVYVEWYEARVFKELYFFNQTPKTEKQMEETNKKGTGFKLKQGEDLPNLGEPKLHGLPAGLVAALAEEPSLPTTKLTQAYAVNVPQVSKARKLAELIRNWEA